MDQRHNLRSYPTNRPPARGLGLLSDSRENNEKPWPRQFPLTPALSPRRATIICRLNEIRDGLFSTPSRSLALLSAVPSGQYAGGASRLAVISSPGGWRSAHRNHAAFDG